MDFVFICQHLKLDNKGKVPQSSIEIINRKLANKIIMNYRNLELILNHRQKCKKAQKTIQEENLKNIECTKNLTYYMFEFNMERTLDRMENQKMKFSIDLNKLSINYRSKMLKSFARAGFHILSNEQEVSNLLT